MGNHQQTPAPHTRGIAARTAIWSARHRALAIIGWLLFVTVVTVLGSRMGTIAATDADSDMGESGRADRIIREAGFPNLAGEMVLVSSRTRTIDDPAFTAAVSEVVNSVRGTGRIATLTSPLEADGAGQVSADKHSALVVFTLSGDRDTAAERVGPVLDAVKRVQRAHPDLYVAEAGEASIDKYIDEELGDGMTRLSLMSIPLTLGILLVAFGAIVAAFLPVGLAVSAVIAAAGLLAFASRAAPTVDTTMHVMLLIGLAVGVDYCMFYIRREREERARGADPHHALAIAAQTSGRSVWISGLTVIVAMAGMFLTRDVTFVSFATATILVVAAAVIGSLTVLPALLSALGDRVDAGRIPGLYRRGPGGRIWRAVLGTVVRRPLMTGLVAALALGALAAPALRLQTKSESAEDFTADLPVIRTYNRVQKTFPGGADPVRVVIRAPDVTAPEVTAAIERFRKAALATGELHEPIGVEVSPNHTAAQVSVGLSGNGTDATSNHALLTLRNTIVPKTLRKAPVTDAAVTGSTAWSYDFNQRLARNVPLVFAFVLALAFVLILVAFRSVVVATTTIVLNLLSVAAAYGLLVLVFQDGRGEDLLDFKSSGALTNWLPLFLFVILFGLSMDYHVLVLSRIREGYDRGLPTRRAIAEGIAGTAGVITSAAVVMVAVFSLLITIPYVAMKEVGFGLAAALLLDATVIRAVLLPAVMALLGERNWYLPRWLRWLPRLSHGESVGESVGESTPSYPVPALGYPEAPTPEPVRAGV